LNIVGFPSGAVQVRCIAPAVANSRYRGIGLVLFESQIRRENQIALPNHPLVVLALALDPVLRISAFGRPQADNFVVPSCCGSKSRGYEIDSLADLESVDELGHRGCAPAQQRNERL
jgi:hypothetical protein